MLECETLNLDRGDLEDFSQVAALTHVTALRMSWTDFDDLADIAPMGQLRELHLSSAQISDLSGLSAFPDLDILHLQRSKNVSNFNPIGQLTGLTELALGGNDVGEIAFVAGLPNLEGLSLVNGAVSSLEALRDHPSMSRLDIKATNLPDDLSALLSIRNLTVVSIRKGAFDETQDAVFEELRQRGEEVDEIPLAVVLIS